METETQDESKILIPPIRTQPPTSLEQHQIQVEDIKLQAELNESRWSSCCFQLHSQSTMFFGKLSVSFAVISLCSYQLIKNTDPSSQALYSSILSSILTFWLSKKN